MAEAEGFLAIWSDIASEQETDYLHWLTREHTAERVGVPGFLGVRVFRARREDVCRYFILYSLQNSLVVKSEAYVERLNSPTPWSRRIMPLLGNFVRGGGSVVAEAGVGQGSLISPLVFPASEKERLKDCLSALCGIDRIVCARLYEVDEEATTIRTNEKSMRTDDRSFALLVILEALNYDALQTGIANLGPTVEQNSQPVLYDQIFALERRGISRSDRL